MTRTPEDVLMHYGVKGMRWGKRQASSESSSSGSSGKPKREVSADHAKVAQLRTKKSSEMSNAELKALTNRLNLEKNYASLTPHAGSRGKAAVATLIGTLTMGVTLYNMAHSPAGKASFNLGQRLVTGAFGVAIPVK